MIARGGQEHESEVRMAPVAEGEMWTIAEAAKRLKMSQVTISRWIKEGRLPACHVGPRAVRIRREDLERLIQPIRNAEHRPLGPVRVGDRVYADISEVPPMTEAEKEALLAWAKDAATLRARIQARRNGVPVPDSAEIIAEMRRERAEHLGNL